MRKRKRIYAVMLLITALLVMQLPVSEADAQAQMGSIADNYVQSFVQKQSEIAEYQDVVRYLSQNNEGNSADKGSTQEGSEGTPSETDSAQSLTDSVDSEKDATDKSANSENGNPDHMEETLEADLNAPQGNKSDEISSRLLGSSSVVDNQAVVFIDNTKSAFNPESGSEHSGSQSTGLENAVGTENNSGNTDLMIEKGGNLPKYTIVNQSKVADQAYYQNSEFQQITLNEGITELGEFSFARSALTEITLPEGTTKISYGAFYHCDSLQSVTLPDTIMCVEPKAFTFTPWIEEFLNNGAGGSGNYLISGGVLLAYRGQEEKPVLPEGIRVIAAEVFQDHGEIRSITLPDSLKVIGEGAFEGCENLTEVKGASAVTTILDRAFSGCPIDTIRIVDTVETIGLGAYDYQSCQKEDLTKAVVFHGTQLPQVSWESSSGRLSNESYRIPSLNDVLFAVVEQTIGEEQLQNTVLHSEQVPYRGLICSIGEDRKLHCRYSNLTQEELKLLQIPDKAYIYGTYYEVTGTEQIKSLAEDTVAPQSGIIQIMGSVGGASAVLEGAQKGYILRIEEATQRQAMEQAYQNIYYTSLPNNTVIYDMILTEETDQVPVTKLGKQNITITIPVPQGLQNQEIQVLALDRNGQLERISSEMVLAQDSSAIQFTTNHFSQFAFYGKGTLYAEAQVTDGQANITSFSRKDDSPDTGDFIHPKWFLGIGLMAAAAALLLSSRKKQVNWH